MQVNARITGVLLNAVDLTSPDYYYYYEYQGKYHDSYYRDDIEPGEVTPADRSAGD
jgi:Mrp family chromosome partitioning ATPase